MPKSIPEKAVISRIHLNFPSSLVCCAEILGYQLGSIVFILEGSSSPLLLPQPQTFPKPSLDRCTSTSRCDCNLLEEISQIFIHRDTLRSTGSANLVRIPFLKGSVLGTAKSTQREREHHRISPTFSQTRAI
jgi:hypothetical protein